VSRKPCRVRDEVRSLGIGLQDRVPNHRKLRGSKVLVVSVPEKAGPSRSDASQKDERK
jgi:hypothetical protein